MKKLNQSGGLLNNSLLGSQDNVQTGGWLLLGQHYNYWEEKPSATTVFPSTCYKVIKLCTSFLFNICVFIGCNGQCRVIIVVHFSVVCFWWYFILLFRGIFFCSLILPVPIWEVSFSVFIFVHHLGLIFWAFFSLFLLSLMWLYRERLLNINGW